MSLVFTFPFATNQIRALTFEGAFDFHKKIDPPLRNESFTWSIMLEIFVRKRLDRFLFSNEWKQGFHQSIQEVLPKFTLDHYLIVLDTNPLK